MVNSPAGMKIISMPSFSEIIVEPRDGVGVGVSVGVGSGVLVAVGGMGVSVGGRGVAVGGVEGEDAPQALNINAIAIKITRAAFFVSIFSPFMKMAPTVGTGFLVCLPTVFVPKNSIFTIRQSFFFFNAQNSKLFYSSSIIISPPTSQGTQHVPMVKEEQPPSDGCSS